MEPHLCWLTGALYHNPTLFTFTTCFTCLLTAAGCEQTPESGYAATSSHGKSATGTHSGARRWRNISSSCRAVGVQAPSQLEARWGGPSTWPSTSEPEMTPDLSFVFSSRQSCCHTVHQWYFPLQGGLMGTEWEITSSTALPDPTASSLGCIVSLAQLCQGQPCALGCWLFPEATAEVPVPTA